MSDIVVSDPPMALARGRVLAENHLIMMELLPALQKEKFSEYRKLLVDCLEMQARLLGISSHDDQFCYWFWAAALRFFGIWKTRPKRPPSWPWPNKTCGKT